MSESVNCSNNYCEFCVFLGYSEKGILKLLLVVKHYKMMSTQRSEWIGKAETDELQKKNIVIYFFHIFRIYFYDTIKGISTKFEV